MSTPHCPVLNQRGSGFSPTMLLIPNFWNTFIKEFIETRDSSSAPKLSKHAENSHVGTTGLKIRQKISWCTVCILPRFNEIWYMDRESILFFISNCKVSLEAFMKMCRPSPLEFTLFELDWIRPCNFYLELPRAVSICQFNIQTDVFYCGFFS